MVALPRGEHNMERSVPCRVSGFVMLRMVEYRTYSNTAFFHAVSAHGGSGSSSASASLPMFVSASAEGDAVSDSKARFATVNNNPLLRAEAWSRRMCARDHCRAPRCRRKDTLLSKGFNILRWHVRGGFGIRIRYEYDENLKLASSSSRSSRCRTGTERMSAMDNGHAGYVWIKRCVGNMCETHIQ